MISFASALDSIGVGKQNQNFTFCQTCSDATYITLSTLQLPDRTVLPLDINMTASGSSFCYNITQTSQLGRYDLTGLSDGCENTFATYFDVTSTGVNQSVSQGIGSAIYLILMLGLMVVFGIAGFRLVKTDKLWILGIFSLFLAVILLVYNTWLGYEYHRVLTGLPDSSIPEIIFYSFLLLLVLGFLSVLVLLFTHWKDVLKYFKKEVRKNEDSDNEFEDLDFDKGAWK